MRDITDVAEENVFEVREGELEVKISDVLYKDMVGRAREDEQLSAMLKKAVHRRWHHILIDAEGGKRLHAFLLQEAWHSPGETRAVERMMADLEKAFGLRRRLLRPEDLEEEGTTIRGDAQVQANDDDDEDDGGEAGGESGGGGSKTASRARGGRRGSGSK